MEVLRARGLDAVIGEVVAQKMPFLGICLGAQIILGSSEENKAACLDLLPGMVRRFPDRGVKVPHMGWNSVRIIRRHPLLDGIDARAQFYFVHSYYPEPVRNEHIIGITHYGIGFASILGSDNLVAAQFHPEKSGPAGLRILKNFSEWNGTV